MAEEQRQTAWQTTDNPPPISIVQKAGGRPSKARGAPNSSDKAHARWTVRGVPANVRKIATKAAENRGMTVGDWLSEVIVQSAKKKVSADHKTNVPAVPMNDLLKLVASLDSRLTEMESNRRQSFITRLFSGGVFRG